MRSGTIGAVCVLRTGRMRRGHEPVLKLFRKEKREGQLIGEASAPSKQLEIYSLATGKVRQLTGPGIGGSHPDWQPLP
jgi:hypothetical protein